MRLRRFFFVAHCNLNHVKCCIGKDTLLYGCKVVSKGSGELFVGNNCIIRNCSFGFYGASGRIVVGDGDRINARPDARTGLYVKDKTSIIIGERSLISNSVELSTTDWHSIIDENGNMLNNNKDIHIGEHVWICRRVLIGKGVLIGDNSIIGAASIVTKSFPGERLLIAGNPAVVKKQGILWK